MGAWLICRGCRSEKWWPDDEFDDQPILEWWASKGEQCRDCRRRATLNRHRTVVTRPALRRSPVAALPRSGTRRREVYDVIRASEGRGMTFEELCGALGRSYNVTGPRVRELVQDGLVVKHGRRTVPGSGATQDVWMAAAYAALSEEDVSHEHSDR